MLNPTDAQVAAMQRELGRLRRDGHDAAAQSWLVWAETRLHTLDLPGPGGPVASTQKILPLVLWLKSKIGLADTDPIQRALHDTLVRVLWEAKCEGRELNETDGHKAIWMVTSGLAPEQN